MGRQYQQTDTTGHSAVAVACSNATGLLSLTRNFSCELSGTPGVSIVAVGTAAAPVTREVGVVFQTPVGEPSLTTWQGGEWTVRLNVVDGGFPVNPNVTWRSTFICRVTSAGTVLSTVGSLRDPQVMSSFGVYEHVVEGQPQTGVALLHRFYIVLVFDIAGTGIQRFSMTPDQLIDTPLEDPVSVASPNKGRSAVTFPRVDASEARPASTRNILVTHGRPAASLGLPIQPQAAQVARPHTEASQVAYGSVQEQQMTAPRCSDSIASFSHVRGVQVHRARPQRSETG